ncbi:MFS transporter [Lentzea sp.]|uniref:MFS transporter n=1 Tax=Lentzea sp. TaxID=56099 RepID=UPI002B51B5BA|nr:MFS transporter [Lentzea sp.]HUQ56231.1 MFS transporter [Lentzea sp.]
MSAFLQDHSTGSTQAWPNPSGGFLFFLGLAAVGAGMGNLVPAVLTTSLKATALDPAGATTLLSTVIGISALWSLLSFPVLGRLSDRTTGRLGRRRPFLLLGAALFVVGAVLMLIGQSTPVLVLSGIATALGFSSATVACTAVVADQFAPERRGPASAVVGLSLPVGAVAGLFIAQLVAPDLDAMILLPAAIAALGCVAFAIRLPDARATRREPFGWIDLLRTFWVSPRRRPDFGWAWLSRLMVFLGVAAIQAYQPFYLIVVLHHPPAEVANAVFLSTLVLTVMALLFAPLAGKLSDRVGRRKPFVVAAAVIFAVGLTTAAFATSFGMFLVAVAIVGLGQGAYFAVDIALITQLLPDPDNPAKDLGIMNIASTLPSSLIPAIAPAVLAIGATAASPQNFTALFVLGAVAGLVGAVLVLPIRKVS